MSILNNSTFTKEFNEMLGKQTETVTSSKMYKAVAIGAMSNNKLDNIREEVAEVIGMPVWNEFTFRCGKVLGLLRTFAYNAKFRKAISVTTGLDEVYADMYFECAGSPAYVNKDGLYVEEIPMNIEATKELVQMVASELGVLVDVSDMTSEKVAQHFASRKAIALKTLENSVTTPIKYEE